MRATVVLWIAVLQQPSRAAQIDGICVYSHSGYYFGTLDGNCPDDMVIGSHTGQRSIPAGWSLAPNDAISQHAAKTNYWGAYYMLFADKVVWATGLHGGGQINYWPGFVENGGDPPTYTIQISNSRIFLRTDKTTTATSITITSSTNTSTSSTATATTVTTTMLSSIVNRGTRKALLVNTQKSAGWPACPVPELWRISLVNSSVPPVVTLETHVNSSSSPFVGWRFLGHLGRAPVVGPFGGPSFTWQLVDLGLGNHTYAVKNNVGDQSGNSYLAINEAEVVHFQSHAADEHAQWVIGSFYWH